METLSLRRGAEIHHDNRGSNFTVWIMKSDNVCYTCSKDVYGFEKYIALSDKLKELGYADQVRFEPSN